MDFSQIEVRPLANVPSNEMSLEQLMFMAESEQKQRGKGLAVPTEDSEVRTWLRTIAEPACLFGEGPYDRRQRLRRLLTLPGRSTHYQNLLASRIAELVSTTVPAQDSEEFFVPATDALLVSIRESLVAFSLERSKLRIQQERQERASSAAIVRQQRLELYNEVRQIYLRGSQVGGERPLSACALSRNAEYIATGDMGGSLRVWDRSDCRLVAADDLIHRSRIGSVVFNPDPNISNLASCDSDGRICVWSLKEDAIQSKTLLLGHTARAASVAYHPRGDLLGSASFDYSWRLWDLQRGCETQLQEGHSRPVYSIAFHNDGSLVCTGGLDAHGRLWDLRLGKAIWTLQGHLKSVLSIDFHPTRPLIASASEDCTVRIWDMRKLQPLYILPAHPAPVSSCRWNRHDGLLLLTASFDNQAAVWGSSDWKALNIMRAHESRINSADISADGKLIVTAGQDRTYKLWSCS